MASWSLRKPLASCTTTLLFILNLSKNSFFIAQEKCFILESGCKGIAFFNTNQTFRWKSWKYFSPIDLYQPKWWPWGLYTLLYIIPMKAPFTSWRFPVRLPDAPCFFHLDRVGMGPPLWEISLALFIRVFRWHVGRMRILGELAARLRYLEAWNRNCEFCYQQFKLGNWKNDRLGEVMPICHHTGISCLVNSPDFVIVSPKNLRQRV